MKNIAFAMTLFSALAFISCKNEVKKEETKDEEVTKEVAKEVKEVKEETKKVAFTLEPKSGSNASGKVEFTENNGKVTMVAKLFGMTPGLHAIHIHEKADCSSADGKSTGGHWNPTFAPHGKWGSEEGYHKGDIGNFEADENGNGTIKISTDEWCIGCGDENKDIIGKAIIVHQGVDDFTTQPTGAAGGRISCGGIIQ